MKLNSSLGLLMVVAIGAILLGGATLAIAENSSKSCVTDVGHIFPPGGGPYVPGNIACRGTCPPLPGKTLQGGCAFWLVQESDRPPGWGPELTLITCACIYRNNSDGSYYYDLDHAAVCMAILGKNLATGQWVKDTCKGPCPSGCDCHFDIEDGYPLDGGGYEEDGVCDCFPCAG